MGADKDPFLEHEHQTVSKSNAPGDEWKEQLYSA